METGREHALGRHDVERIEAGDPRQQIEVSLVEPIGVGNPVRDGDDDVTNRVGRRLRDQPFAQRVLVAPAGLAYAPLVVAERVREEPRLDPHSLRRPIDLVRPERLLDELLESFHLLRLATELVVETQHLGNQSGPQLKRQLVAARCRGVRGRLRHDVALERAQPARRIRQPALQPVIQLVARHDIGPLADEATELMRRTARGDDHENGFGFQGAGFRVRSRFCRRESRDRLPKPP